MSRFVYDSARGIPRTDCAYANSGASGCSRNSRYNCAQVTEYTYYRREERETYETCDAFLDEFVERRVEHGEFRFPEVEAHIFLHAIKFGRENHKKKENEKPLRRKTTQKRTHALEDGLLVTQVAVVERTQVAHYRVLPIHLGVLARELPQRHEEKCREREILKEKEREVLWACRSRRCAPCACRAVHAPTPAARSGQSASRRTRTRLRAVSSQAHARQRQMRGYRWGEHCRWHTRRCLLHAISHKDRERDKCRDRRRGVGVPATTRA